MYKLVETEKEIMKVRAFCAKGYFGARINTHIAAYGTDDRFIRTWFEEKDGALVGVMQLSQGAACVHCTDEADFESLSALLLFTGVQTVIGEREYIENLPFATRSQGVVMSFEKGVAESENALPVDGEQVHLLYPVLYPGQSDRRAYMQWYADISHRVRHGFTSCFAVFQKDKIVSCSAVLYGNAQYGCIGAVATLPEYRKQGFGRDCTLAAVQSVLKDGQIPCLACLDNGIENWYESMGFTVCGQWSQMQL